MMETPVRSDSLYNQTSTLNYSQALMMGLTGGHRGLPDQQQQSYSNHGNIPNIILTGASFKRVIKISEPDAVSFLLMFSSKPRSFIF